MSALANERYLARSEKAAIGGRIRDLRVSGNLTGAVFGATIGVTQGTVAAWESRGGAPRAASIANICRTYAVSADWLIAGASFPTDFTAWGNDRIGERLKSLRQDMGLTTDLLARSLGTSAATLSAIENAKASIPLRILFCLYEGYAVRADWLLLGREPAFARGSAGSCEQRRANTAGGDSTLFVRAAKKLVYSRMGMPQ